MPILIFSPVQIIMGYPLNETGMTPLEYANYNNEREIVKLIEASLNLNDFTLNESPDICTYMNWAK